MSHSKNVNVQVLLHRTLQGSKARGLIASRVWAAELLYELGGEAKISDLGKFKCCLII